MSGKTLYSILERTSNSTTARKYFKNRHIKGDKILKTTKDGAWTKVHFIKTRKRVSKPWWM